MKKFLRIFEISLSQEFTYKVNFVMWRVRNLITILMVYFLWESVYGSENKIIFGYDKSRMMSYVVGIVIMKAIVLSSRAVDVSGEISNGDLMNQLLKPVNYFKYWITRDIASKALNLSFAIIEVSLIVTIFKPFFFVQTNPVQLIVFVISVILAAFIFFCLLFIVSSVSFWAPEYGWGAHFLITVVAVEFLSGALYPLDIFPDFIVKVLKMTPFPYMIYFPIQTYLGGIEISDSLLGILISIFWSTALYYLMKYIWKKGLRIYQAYGR